MRRDDYAAAQDVLAGLFDGEFQVDDLALADHPRVAGDGHG